MIYTQEHVQMYHPLLKEFTSLYIIHLWLASTPFALSYKFYLQKAFLFFLGHLQFLSEYHFIQPFRKNIYRITIFISILVQNKMSETSISLKKSEGIMYSDKTSISLKKPEGIIYSGNKLNTRNKNCWKIMLLVTKINLCYCKIYQKLL